MVVGIDKDHARILFTRMFAANSFSICDIDGNELDGEDFKEAIDELVELACVPATRAAQESVADVVNAVRAANQERRRILHMYLPDRNAALEAHIREIDGVVADFA